MDVNDIILILQWWLMFLALGISCLPLTLRIFTNFFDKGYIFSKILSLGILSYIVFVLGTFRILPFSVFSVALVLLIIAAVNFFLRKDFIKMLRKILGIVIFEEALFLAAFLLWSFVRGASPDIRGLEKFMDFGFINSILRSDYFPPKDIWLTPLSINYYYFGHLIIAVLAKLSAIKPPIVFNVSLATIFAFTFVGSFSIGANLIYNLKKKWTARSIILGGVLTGSFVSLEGNLQTLYAFFLPYSGENSPPFWQLIFSPNSFPNSYWYPNATRFIFHTIHEFPIYSFVVSDLHAHVLSLPFVIFIIAALLSIFISKTLNKYSLFLVSFILAILYMTNTWDTVTYFLLAALVIFYVRWKNNSSTTAFIDLFIIAAETFVLILPFSIHFTPFTQGIGIICPPQFLLNLGNLGPFIFEVGHCERSPIWQLFVLYGFFFFWIISFIVFIKRKGTKILKDSDFFAILLIILSLALIILPEFVYIKDIYTGHYRANTMFKFAYQAFIMLQICSAYIVFRIFSEAAETKVLHLGTIVIFVIGTFLSFLVFLYPVFAVNSYYNGLKNYSGLDGAKYLQTSYPNDFTAINWLNKNIKGQLVILEAQGDSYSDFARISSNTGLPTVLGWSVHEWLWRGSYDVAAPRIADVRMIYETPSEETAKQLLKKYDVSYVYIGDMERQKYQNLNEEKFNNLGKVVFQSGNTRIYKIN